MASDTVRPRPERALGEDSGVYLGLALADVEARLQRGEAEHAVLEARALLERLRREGSPAQAVRGICLLAGAYTQLGHYRDAVALLDEADQVAQSAGLEEEIVRMGATAAAVLAADGRPDAALHRITSIRRGLETLMADPVDASLKAAHNFAFVSMDLGLHAVAETWFDRITALRERFTSPRTGLHSISAYARLRIERGLVARYRHHEDEAHQQFRHASRLGLVLAKEAEDTVWEHTGVAFEALASALMGRHVETATFHTALWDAMDSQTNKHLRCVVRFALTAGAVSNGAWQLAASEFATALPLAEDVGFVLFGIELRRLAAMAAQSSGDRDTAAAHEAAWASRWRAYEWSARLRAAEYTAG